MTEQIEALRRLMGEPAAWDWKHSYWKSAEMERMLRTLVGCWDRTNNPRIDEPRLRDDVRKLLAETDVLTALAAAVERAEKAEAFQKKTHAELMQWTEDAEALEATLERQIARASTAETALATERAARERLEALLAKFIPDYEPWMHTHEPTTQLYIHRSGNTLADLKDAHAALASSPTEEQP